jgi:hypothetical protein
MKIEGIVIKDRYRKAFRNIDRLADSIEAICLLHPVVVDQNNRLVCGARRVKAFEFLGREEIPARRSTRNLHGYGSRIAGQPVGKEKKHEGRRLPVRFPVYPDASHPTPNNLKTLQSAHLSAALFLWKGNNK